MSEAGEGNPRMLGSDMSKLKCQKECLDMPDDSICRICLSEFIVDSCQAQPCMHKFCFVCLVEWCKVKRRCPLCKEKLSSIIHNMRPDGDYDIYYPTKTTPKTHEPKPGTSTSSASQIDSCDSDIDTDFEFYDSKFFSTENDEPIPSCSYTVQYPTHIWNKH